MASVLNHSEALMFVTLTECGVSSSFVSFVCCFIVQFFSVFKFVSFDSDLCLTSLANQLKLFWLICLLNINLKNELKVCTSIGSIFVQDKRLSSSKLETEKAKRFVCRTSAQNKQDRMNVEHRKINSHPTIDGFA